MPVACHTALAMAPAVPVMPISPTPFTPSVFTTESSSGMRIASIGGMSAFTGTWYSARLSLRNRPVRGSISAFSCRAKEMPQIMPP